MATLVYPSSFNLDSYRYNQGSSSWLKATNNTESHLYAGRTSSGTVYRAYFYVPGQTALAGAVINSITLTLPISDEYNSDGRWDIGIMTSQPTTSVAYNTSGFTRIAEDVVAAESTTLTVTIPVSTWGDVTVGKYIVIVQSQARGTSYGYKGIYCNATNGYPKITFNYTQGLVYIDNGSGWDAYEVYIDNGSSWVKYMPYIDNGSSWDLYT